MMTTTATTKCGKCDGKGVIEAFYGTAHGKCFQCWGAGTVRYASRVGQWTRAKVIAAIADWFASPVRVRNWGDESAPAIADLICRAPADVFARALSAAPRHLSADVAAEVARLCSFWRKTYEADGKALR